jgi:hypothetical protein
MEEEVIPDFTCVRCGESGPTDDTYTVQVNYREYEEWCIGCFYDDSSYCDYCDNHLSHDYRSSEEIDNGDMHWCEVCTNNNAYYCSDCYGWNSSPCNEHNLRLNSYSFKPRPVFYRTLDEPTSTPCYGIELETENVHGSRTQAFKTFLSHMDENTMYAKEDGSLYDGMELVSHPRSLASWREFAPTMSAMLTDISRDGMRAWTQSRCGLHIHIGWDNFTKSHALRMALLFSRNPLDWIRAANRKSSYASFETLAGNSAAKVKNPVWANHSDAVNLGANGGKTIEIRIFRPSLAINRIIGSIELVEAAYYYTKDMTAYTAIRGGLNFGKFEEFLKAGGKYPLAERIINNQRFALEEGNTSCA